MFRLRKFLSLAAFGCLLFGSASVARADYEIVISETGFATITLAGLTSGANNNPATQTIGQYSVSVSTHDSSPGINIAQGGALLTQNELSVTTNATPTADLVVQVFDSTFSSLGTPMSVKNSLSSTEVDAGTVSAFTYVNTVGNATPTLTITGLASPSNTASLVQTNGSTFTLGNVATIHGLSGGVGFTDNFTVTSVASAVPEPATMALVFSAVPFAGLAALRRRRKAAVAL